MVFLHVEDPDEEVSSYKLCEISSFIASFKEILRLVNTSARLVVLDKPIAISLYVLMDIDARLHQCATTMIIDTQTGFRMTLSVEKYAKTSLTVSLMRFYDCVEMYNQT